MIIIIIKEGKGKREEERRGGAANEGLGSGDASGEKSREAAAQAGEWG